MTALCSGGTSSPRAGFGLAVSFGASSIAALLNNVPTVWAVPLAGFIGVVTYNLANFCNTDPPALPTFTAVDVVNIMNPFSPDPYLTAQQKFQDLIGYYAWFQVCQCDSMTTPAPAAPPAAPTGMPSINPVTPLTPDPNLSAPCFTYPSHIRPFDTGTSYPQAEEYGIQSGMTGINLKFTWPGTPVLPVVSVTWHVEWRDASHGTLQNETTRTIGAVDPLTIFYVIPPRAVWFVVWLDSHTNFNNNYELQWDVDGYCNNLRPGGDVPACCPPDPVIEQLLNNILGMVTLIQRQAAPFAYVAGAVHSGLSGDGSISVQGLLGAKVSVVDGGYEEGIEAGDPDAIWNVGWINWGNADGYSERQWIGTAEFLTLPALAGQYTQLNYSLKPGVQVDITELEREP